MTFLLDTSVLIDHLRGHDGALQAVSQAAGRGERLICSVVTKVEVLAGVRPGEEAATRMLLDALDWVAVSDVLAERAGDLAARYLRSHPGVDPVDFIIAATTEEMGATLWTRNVKHFPMFPELVAPY